MISILRFLEMAKDEVYYKVHSPTGNTLLEGTGEKILSTIKGHPLLYGFNEHSIVESYWVDEEGVLHFKVSVEIAGEYIEPSKYISEELTKMGVPFEHEGKYIWLTRIKEQGKYDFTVQILCSPEIDYASAKILNTGVNLYFGSDLSKLLKEIKYFKECMERRYQ